MKRSGIKRRAPLKPGKKKLGPGKKTNKWATVRSGLKISFEAAGITTCELRYPGCWFDDGLGFAHAKKRRKLREGELSEVALLCNPCHNKIEFLPAEEMEAIVNNIITKRESYQRLVS